MTKEPITSVKDLPLRERKAARTRIRLLDALLSALSERPFRDVKVRELCREVGISEPTFFNYFPSKEETLVFFVYLWSIGVRARMEREERSGRELVDLVFEVTADQIEASPRIMHEIIAHQMRMEDAPLVAPPSLAERMMYFPDEPSAWELEPVPIQSLIEAGLRRAEERGELAAEAPVEAALWTLVALFFGVPASTREANQVARRYRDGVGLVWSGLVGPD